MKKLMMGVLSSALTVLTQCHSNEEPLPEPQPQKQPNQSENPYEKVDIAQLMAGVEGTFVMYDKSRDLYVRFNETRAKKRFSPCSTFKIPNTLIALETGVAKSAYTTIRWDRDKYPKQPFWDELKKTAGVDWARDHTLKSAFRNSAVWCYREIAQKVGEDRMRGFLAKFDYGNQDISSGINRFWLEGSLEISAKEQVAFLGKLLNRQLGLSPKTLKAAFEVFEAEKVPGYTLYAKTGGGHVPGEPAIGWYVGIVRKGEADYIFAFNMAGRSYEDVATKRVKTAKAILKALGILPKEGNDGALIS